METIKIMTGFQEIRTELRKKRPGFVNNTRLVLVFKFNKGILTAHDYYDMNQSILLAIEFKNEWKINVSGFAADLIRYALQKAKPRNVAFWLNDLYADCGDR